MDLSWDDVRAEAEQRNVGQTVNQNRHFFFERTGDEKRVESKKCQMMIFVRSNRARLSQDDVRQMVADNTDGKQRGRGVSVESGKKNCGMEVRVGEG